MEHRHLDTKQWSASAIDSALEYGDLKDWQELFSAARQDEHVAALVLKVTSERDLGGASVLAKALVTRHQAGIGTLKMPSGGHSLTTNLVRSEE